jgi:hypothetical protein
MTKEEDKLVAIRGIAQQVGQALNDHLVAGLWYNRLLEELCWFKKPSINEPPPRKLKKWRAPTWSWASSNAITWISNTTKSHLHCQNKQIWGELEDLNVKANASGELEYASLRIRCKPICAILKPDSSSSHKVDSTFCGILTLQNSMMVIKAQRSGNSELGIELDDWGWEGPRHVHMIVIQRCPDHSCLRPKADDEGDEDDEDDTSDEEAVWGALHPYFRTCVEGLLLVPQHGCDDIFERVGLFSAKGRPTVVKVVKEHEAAESKTITLI